MGKSRAFYTVPHHAGRRPSRCLGCHKPITYGDRCPPCATLVRTRAAKRRRRR